MSFPDWLEQNYQDIVQDYIDWYEDEFEAYCQSVYIREGIVEDYGEWKDLEFVDLTTSYIDYNYKHFEEFAINSYVGDE